MYRIFIWYVPADINVGNLLLLQGRKHRAPSDYSPVSNLFGQKEIPQLFESAETWFGEVCFCFLYRIKMNKEAITRHSSQELSLPSPLINWGKRQPCARQPSTGALAFSRLNQRQGKPRGRHPACPTHHHVRVHTHAGGRHSGSTSHQSGSLQVIPQKYPFQYIEKQGV